MLTTIDPKLIDPNPFQPAAGWQVAKYGVVTCSDECQRAKLTTQPAGKRSERK